MSYKVSKDYKVYRYQTLITLQFAITATLYFFPPAIRYVIFYFLGAFLWSGLMVIMQRYIFKVLKLESIHATPIVLYQGALLAISIILVAVHFHQPIELGELPSSPEVKVAVMTLLLSTLEGLIAWPAVYRELMQEKRDEDLLH